MKDVRTHIYERDYLLAAALKERYGHKCQICETTFPTTTGGSYSETHHLLPLGMGGFDVEENIVVVCPTCHRKFHSGSDEVIVEVSEALPSQFGTQVDKYLRLR